MRLGTTVIELIDLQLIGTFLSRLRQTLALPMTREPALRQDREVFV